MASGFSEFESGCSYNYMATCSDAEEEGAGLFFFFFVIMAGQCCQCDHGRCEGCRAELLNTEPFH